MLLDFVFRQFNEESDPLTNLKDNSQCSHFSFLLYGQLMNFFLAKPMYD